MRVGLVAAIAALSLAALAQAKDPYVYGPEPDWARYKELGEAAVRAQLPPGDWSIEWPNGYWKGDWFHGRLTSGYTTCGIARTTAPPKGYVPLTNFAVVIDHDTVAKVEISNKSNRVVNMRCGLMVDRGFLPPARLMEAPKDLAIAGLGLTIRPMPEGAYIVSVTPGRAEIAGLKPGIVITRANGIALAGLGSAMQQVLASDAPTLALDTAAGTHLEVKRAP